MRILKLKSAELMPLATEVLERGGSLSFEVCGSSMFPFICDGDVLTVQYVASNYLRVGDVVFYLTAG